MTFSSIIALVSVWIAAITLPGPDTLQITRLGTKEKHAGIMCAIGIMVGNTLWIVSSLIGLAAIMAKTPSVIHAIQLIGGGYIAWIGFCSIRAAVVASRQQTDQNHNEVGLPLSDSHDQQRLSHRLSPWAALRTGILTNLANPKAVVFFAAIFAQFLPPQLGVAGAVVIAGILIVTGLLWFVGFAVGVHTMAAKIVKNAAIIDLISGVIFTVIGVVMIYEGVWGLAKHV